MLIVGKKYLDNNSYNTIIIHSSRIDISNKKITSDVFEKDKEFNNASSFSKEMVYATINQFLNNGKIVYFSSKKVIDDKGRILLFINSFKEDIEQIILKKYIIDRNNYLNENLFEEYLLDTKNGSSYYNSEGKYVLSSNDSELDNYELEFLIYLISTVYSNEIIGLIKREYTYDKYDIISFSSDKIIKLSQNLGKRYFDNILDIIVKHNNEVEKNKNNYKLEVKNGK